MDSKKDKDRVYRTVFIFATVFVILNVYWFGFATFLASRQTSALVSGMAGAFADASFMRSPYTLKWWILALLLCTFSVKSGSGVDTEWSTLLTLLCVGLILFFMPLFPKMSLLYIITTLSGYALLCYSVAMIARKFSFFRGATTDLDETFEQNTERIDDPLFVNYPMEFRWRHRTHRGWINSYLPAGTLIMGTPGTGKSFTLYHGLIRQMIDRKFAMMIYDYKMPDLTEVAYNYYMRKYAPVFREKGDWYEGMTDSDGKLIPQFCVINFDDPRYSMRCNPLSPAYITDPADTAEIADLIMRNVNPDSIEKEDFFTMSAKSFIDSQIWFLRIYRDGKFCDFPHLIELMGRSYERVFEMLQQFPEIKVKLTPFANALAGDAQEQLQGQIASAQIPLMRFASPALYWVLSGDEFTLDINHPDHPKILCIGNNPDRQSIYGTTLSLYTSRFFKASNHEGRIPCGCLLDEFPTIRVTGISNTIDTARSRKVCVVLGCQDKSQIVRDYGDKEAEVIFNSVRTIFSGQVNGRTAKELAETFGREFREQQSQTTGGEHDTVNTSYHQQEILPQSRIEQLSPGTFFGKMADTIEHPIRKKLFCARVKVDMDDWKDLRKGWRRLPKMSGTVFGDEPFIRERVLANPDPYIREKINNDIVREDIRRQKNDETYRPRTFTLLDEEVSRRIAALTGESRARLIEELIDEKERLEVKKVIEAKYESIREDVDSIFIDLNVPMDPPEKKSRKK